MITWLCDPVRGEVMKVSMPELPFVSVQPARPAPLQEAGEQDVEQDAALFRQSLSENKESDASKQTSPAGQEQADAAEGRPGTQGAAQHGRDLHDAARHKPGKQDAAQHERAAQDAARHEHGTADAARHEHGTADAARHEPGTADAARHEPGTADAARHEPGTADAARHEHGTADAAAQQGGMNKAAADNVGPQAAQAGDSPGAAETDEKDTETPVETGQDLQQLLATQEARSHDIAAQGTAEVAPAISPELVDNVAERILVSVGNDGQDREVRILVKDSVLQNTEVSLKYEQGDLVVNFITQSASDNVLLNNNSQALQTSLEKALDGGVRVNVSAETGDAGDARDDRRSRGMYIDEEENDG